MNERTHLYRLYDANGHLLYIGISNRPIRRWIEHLVSQPWADDIAQMHRGPSFATRREALDAERAAIQAEAPLHNITHNEFRDQRARRASRQEMAEIFSPLVLIAISELGAASLADLHHYFESYSLSLVDAVIEHLRNGTVRAENGYMRLTTSGMAALAAMDAA